MELFCALATQWRAAPQGQVLGLDYAAVKCAVQLRGTPRRDWPALFADLQVLERAALDLLDEQRSAQEA